MKILIVDRKLKHAGWKEKEGEVLKRAFEKIGEQVTIAGKGYPNSELSIEELSKHHDICIITENYWNDWAWWSWSDIKTPKYIWSIDYEPTTFGDRMSQFVTRTELDGVFTIDSQINQYMEYSTGKRHFYLPYAIFSESKEVKCEKDTDILFIGSPYKERLEIFPKETVYRKDLFGEDYYRAICGAKINLNWSLTDAINGKVFEIISANGFLITNRTKHVSHLFRGYINTYNSKDDLESEVKRCLNDDDYREDRRKALHSFCMSYHTYEDRARSILEIVSK